MRETKPGWQTTEFWLVIIGNLLVNVGAMDVGGAKYRGLFAILSVVGYSLARGWAKSGVPDGGFVPPIDIGDDADLGDDVPDTPIGNTNLITNLQSSGGVYDFKTSSSTVGGPEPEGVPKPPDPSGD